MARNRLFVQSPSVMKFENARPDLPEQAVRMRLLRTWISGDKHGSISDFSREIGVGVTRWSNVENGSPVSHALADTLVKAFPGLTLDWIYYGRVEGMSVDMARALREIQPSDKAVI